MKASVPIAAFLAACLALASAPLQAQAPAPPTPTAPAPLPPVTIPAPPPVAGTAARPTLIPQAGDPSNVDEVVLPEKPVLLLAGSSKWEEGLKNLRASFARIEAELARLGIAPAGRPLALFIQTGEDDFRFEAMIPVAARPDPAPPVGTDLRWGATPSGRAFRFVHKGPYDDVEGTYDLVTTYIDAKDIVAKDQFLEEFLDDIADPADGNLELNIFVQPR